MKIFVSVIIFTENLNCLINLNRAKQELVEKKKEDDRARRKAILEQYMQRKAAMEEQEVSCGLKT